MKTQNASDKLHAEYNAILARLDREARRDRCKGDICTGWDWPTLAIVKPVEHARLRQIQSEMRGLRSAGLLAA